MYPEILDFLVSSVPFEKELPVVSFMIRFSGDTQCSCQQQFISIAPDTNKSQEILMENEKRTRSVEDCVGFQLTNTNQ